MNPVEPPPRPPPPPPPSPQSTTNSELIADGQRMIIYAILVNIAGLLLRGALGSIFGLLVLASIVLSLLGVYRVSSGFGMPIGTKVLLLIGMFVPFVSLIIMVVLNAKATKALRAAGYRVGLLGATK